MAGLLLWSAAVAHAESDQATLQPAHALESPDPAPQPTTETAIPEPRQEPSVANEPADSEPAPEVATTNAAIEATAVPVVDEPARTALPAIDIQDDAPSLTTIDLTVKPDNLWQRIRNGFGMPDLANPRVADRQAHYLNRPEMLNQIIERSRMYLHHIVAEVERRGMPTELALLPMIESAFNPMARSRARALGMWQFMPSTGKNYKLDQNFWRDERRDIIASTSAALDYLQKTYEMHGDWHLALASYNWGEGAVGRAVAKNRAQGLPTDYSSLAMPKETRFYVPKLQALKNIIAQPELFGFQLDAVPNRPYFDTVPLPGDMDVAVAARLAEMPVEQFIALNPAFHRPLIRGDRRTQLVLPTDKVATFRANLKRHEAQDHPLTHWRTHTLKAGERLDGVALRHGLSLAGLSRINGITRRTKVQPGMNLLVPGPGANLPEKIMAHLPTMPSESAGAGKGGRSRHAAAGKARSKATGTTRKSVSGRKR